MSNFLLTNRSVAFFFSSAPLFIQQDPIISFQNRSIHQLSISGMADTAADEVKPRDSFSFWNDKAKQPQSPPSISPREDHGPKSMPSGLTDKVKLIEQALAKPKLGGFGAPASSPPAPTKDKKDKKIDIDDNKEPSRKGSRSAQTPTIGKRDSLTGSAGPSPISARNGTPIIPNIVSSPMFDKKIKSAAEANKTLNSSHRLPDDENDKS